MGGSAGQNIGSAVGFVVGAYFGYPQLGFVIGNALGGAIDPPVIKAQGQKIGELAKQTAKEGEPRAIIFGTSRPIGGNIIAAKAPAIIKIKTKSGGKGGQPKVTTTTEIVERTYAIGICEGPINGIRRIWRDGKLVYDGSGKFSGNNNNFKFLQNKQFFLGNYDQSPSSYLQSELGANDIPAFRGTAYMVSYREDLTDRAGSIPNFLFEVVRSEGFSYTSKPYSIYEIDDINMGGLSADEMAHYHETDSLDMDTSVVSGTLNDLLEVYSGPDEIIDMTSLSVEQAVLSTLLLTYSDGEPEIIDMTSLSVEQAELRVALIEYEEWPTENIDMTSLEITGATLT